MRNEFWRYDRQMRFEAIGRAGQEAIRKTSVVVVGCGALGSVVCDQLVRAGVGRVTIVDRDVIELHNLQRQPLFTEKDFQEGLPKAVAAERALKEANGEVQVLGVVADVNYRTAKRLCDGADLIVDGTDNFETRLLLNDVALELGIPWIYGGAVGSEGRVKAIVPGETSCLRCLMDGPPPPGESPTCETAGIIAPTAYMVGSLEVSLALKLICGEQLSGDLIVLDSWEPLLRAVAVPRLEDCPACVRGERLFLEGIHAGSATVMCGRETVQVLPPNNTSLDMVKLASELTGLGEVEDRRFYLSFDDGELWLSVFPDGRCLVHNTNDPNRAKAAVARYLGG